MTPVFVRRWRRKSVIVATTAVAVAALALAPQVSANATDPSVDPSGQEPVRTGWWQPAYIDEFTGHSINKAAWAVYNSPKKKNPRGVKLASNVIVHDGMVTL